MRRLLLLITAFFSIAITTAQTFSTNTSPVGMEHNILFNATTNYTVTQTGPALNLGRLFDGTFVPSYTSTGPTAINPTVVLIEDLPSIHTQAGAWVGWSTRYWEARNFKIEGYDVDNNDNIWRTIADYTSTTYTYTNGRQFSVKVPGSTKFTKLRFTFYNAVGTDGRLGVSELFFIHPEATTPYANLGLGSWEKNGSYLTPSSANRIGIGTSTPEEVLDVRGHILIGGADLKLGKYDGREQGARTANRALVHYNNDRLDINFAEDFEGGTFVHGSLETSKNLNVGGNLEMSLGEGFKLHGNNNYFGNSLDGVIFEIQDTNGSNSAVDGGFVFRGLTTTDNIHKDIMVLKGTGNVGIGTNDPKNKLSVNGTIWAKKVTIQLTDAADWVFEEDYNLRPLSEVAEFIKTYKHLPEIPSADEFRANDMEVSEMSNKLLQKIEELTLYTIAQEEQLVVQKEQLKTQQQKLAAQEARLAKLEALLSE